MLVSRIYIPEPTPRSNTRTRVRGVAIYPFGLSLSHLRRATVVMLAGSAILWFLWQVQDILPPFIISFFLAALMEPTLRANEERGRPRWRTIATFYALVFCTIGLTVVLIVPRATSQLNDVSRNFSRYFANVQKRTEAILREPRNKPMLNRLGIKEEKLSDLLNERSGPLGSAVSNVVRGVSGFAQGLASKLLWLVIIPIASLFLMLDYPLMRARLITLFPESSQQEADQVSRQIIEVFSAYLRGLTKVCFLFGLVVTIWLWMLGINYALILGVFAGLFYAVPYVGMFGMATILGAVSYSMEPHKVLFLFNVPGNSIGYAVFAVLSVMALNFIYDQIITPRIVGGAVGLHPLVSLFAVTAGATVFGVAGMLLAMPVAGSIQVILRELFPKLKEPPRLLSVQND
jgi:predicted PurR-regulated permease PerM